MADLKQQVKEMIIQRLKLEGMQPEDIDDQAPLFGDGLGLDSIDALELVLGVEQVFGVKIGDEASGSRALKSVEALAAFIQERQGA